MPCTVEKGEFMVESMPNAFNKNRVARVEEESLPNCLFHIRVVNTSNVSVTLSKKIKLAHIMKAPSTIGLIQNESEVNSVIVVPIYTVKLERERQFAQQRKAKV